MDTVRTDVAVVGAGPIGLELAVALKRSGIDYVHLEAKQVGYTISWFAPQTRFFSSNERIAIAGVPLQTADQGKASREEYLAYLRSVVEQFDLQIQTYSKVVGIQRQGGEFQIDVQRAGHRQQVRANRLVLCTGGTDHPRRLNIPGEDLPHVSHYFQDPHPYFRKRLLIVGGKNSAVETALRCHHAGAHVTLSYRRDQLNPKSIKYWLLPEINGLIAEGKIVGLFNTVPTEITPSEVVLVPVGRDAGKEEDAGMRGHGDTGKENERGATSPHSVSASPRPRVPASLSSDFVLMQIGFEQDTTLLKLAGVELTGSCHAPTFDEATMQTNVPGIYVAGTAVGGTQDKYRVFIENCHVHVARIIAALTGSKPPEAPAPLTAPES
jgi:thioredoxin reductase (NADPH)